MKELVEFFAQQQVSPDGWFLMASMRQNVAYPQMISYVTVQHKLSLSGYLESAVSAAGTRTYKLTDKALHFLKAHDDLIYRLKRQKKQQVPFSEWEQQIREFVDSFPPIRGGGNQLVRSNPKVLFERFQWFFSEYPEYTWPVVQQATVAYIRALAATQYAYISTAKYFIKKEDKNRNVNSPLADWCMQVVDGNLQEIDETIGKGHFHTDVV